MAAFCDALRRDLFCEGGAVLRGCMSAVGTDASAVGSRACYETQPDEEGRAAGTRTLPPTRTEGRTPAIRL